MKKKLLSLALALALSMSLAVPAFAAEEDKTAAPTETAGDKKEETPAEGEDKKDEAPAEGEEKKDETPAEGEEKKDETPAEGEDKKDEAEAPAEGEDKKDEAPAAPKFTDVAADSPFAKAIDWAVAGGITNGTTPTTFGPGNDCTVSHILTFLWRANGKPGAAEGVKDRDAAAKWALEQGMIPSISPEEYNLDGPCNRGAAVIFMWTAAGKPEVTSEKKFTDVPEENANLVNATAWAFENGVTTGTGDGTTFSSANKCTRGQIVTFLFRAANAAAAQ